MWPARGGAKLRRADLVAITVAVGFLAFAVRFAWLLRVQSPFTAAYSDMGAYLARADAVFRGYGGADPRMFAFYPWGTHVLMALEFAAFGRNSPVSIAVVYAAIGALTPIFATLLTARLVPRASTVGLAGLTVALWQPQIASAAFFMSEMWFSAALMIGTWLAARSIEGGGVERARPWAPFAAGSAFAVAFAIRPQVVLTGALVVLALLPRLVREAGRLGSGWLGGLVRLVGRHATAWGRFAAPVAVVLVFSALRLHELTGHYGLISENGAIMRLFADTDVGRIEASWEGAKGEPYSAWYSPGTKAPIREQNIARFHSYVADAEILERIRQERLRGVPLRQRVQRTLRNVSLLAWHNYPNPEEDFHSDPKRAFLQRLFARATLALLPFAAVGAFCMRRRAAGILVLANLATIVVVAAVYFAEARYRVPYDPFVIVAAAVGAASVARFLRRALGLLASRSRVRAR